MKKMNIPTFFNHEKTIRSEATTQDTFGFIQITSESFKKFEKILKMPMWGGRLFVKFYSPKSPKKIS